MCHATITWPKILPIASAYAAQGSATQQNPELKHPQNGSVQKRIVLK